LTLVLLTVQV